METDSKWRPEYKKDVVYLFVWPRSYAGSVVNISPFALKLELFLRISGISFEVTFIQSNFNGSIIFGTLKIYSRQG